ncbi:hypothetical protein F2Q70_00045286 [Brassica cretica]|uniref:Uncharacterized protein n=1 Tax=Brassica cretica TaxID=69181 RepID=A0A8S9KE06_BRACR|nr:hypothetical protein F2Q70_00045286 [Brassica cretica]
MVVWEEYVSDETMGTIAPIIVYWIYAGVNQFLSPSLDKYRLHTLDEENEKNVIPITTVVKGVLLQQLLQILITQLGFFCAGKIEGHVFAEISWANVCLPKREWGLNLRIIITVIT